MIFYIENRNEHLRDGLLSLVHSYSLLENKLDRHEQRERALGDVIKRGLQTLQKGQKIFEPIRGTFSRLDERMSQIEGVLMAQDEKFNEHQTEIRNSLEAIKKLVASDGSKATVEKPADGSVGQLSKQVEDLSVNVKELRREIGELLKKPADTTSKGLLEQTEKMINSKLSSADDVIARIEEKLTHFYVTAPVNPPSNDRNVEWENNVSKSLQEIKTNVNAMKSNDITSSNSRDGSDSPALDKDFFVTLANQTLEAIEDMRLEVLTASDKSFTKTASRIKESADKLDGSINEVLKTIESTSSDGNQDGVRSSISELKKEFNALAKLEQMLAQMGDNVLSVKRGMEFNVHAVSLEVGEVVKANTRELNETINSRFDAINNTISRNHNGALANLTSKIETEISQVWRQIGIMYQEVSSSKDAVNKLQERTETYVNGTLTTMDSMEGKVRY